MRVALTDQNDPMTAGFIGSIIFHIFILLTIVFGVPSFFEPEILEQPPTIEAALVSDITAAPKVQKVSNKKPDKPKAQPAPETPKPKAETPPPPAPPTPAAPPPPAPEQQAVVIPDPTQKPEEKKQEEKKLEEPKKETKKPDDKTKKPPKKQDDELASLLNSVLKDQPAPEPTAKPKKNTPPPAEPTEGPQAALTNDVPLTQSESDGIANQIRPNWNVDVGALPDPRDYVAFLRVTFAPDGTVMTVDFLDRGRLSDPRYRQVAESCKRAFFITKQVRFPPGKEQGTIRFGCDPSSM